MKKYIILFFILLNFQFFCQEKTYRQQIKILNEFYGYDEFGNEKYMQYVSYKNMLGFKYDNVYFLTEKEVFEQTIKQRKKNFKWYIYCDNLIELLRVRQHIWVLTIYNSDTNIIEFVITTDFDYVSINHVYFCFNRKNLK